MNSSSPPPPTTQPTAYSAGAPCVYCGGTAFIFQPVLWRELIDEWGLSEEEEAYIDRQQGVACTQCGHSLRSLALAKAILSARHAGGTFRQWLRRPWNWRLRLLECNGAGTLTSALARLPRRELASYPAVDMQKMPFADDTYDLVIHSDTLEHVPDPIQALRECRRVLKPGGFCCFTVPIVVGRISRARAGLPPSYHGGQGDNRADYLVQTEYGADFWTHVARAGFDEIRIVSLDFPVAQAVAARKPTRR